MTRDNYFGNAWNEHSFRNDCVKLGSAFDDKARSLLIALGLLCGSLFLIG